MAKSTLGSLLIDLQLNTATLNKQVDKIDKRFDGMGKTLKKVGVALAGAFAVGQFTSMIKNTLALNDALGKTADRLGVAVEDLQALHFSAEQSGISIPTLEMALQRMTRRVAEAGQGTGEAVKALKELGIEADSLSKMSVNEQLEVLADALQGVTSEGDKVRLAMKLFDSEGVKLLTMLQNGSKGLKEYADEADKLGFIIDRQMIGMMERANDSMNKVARASQGVKNVITTALAPAITVVVDNFLDWATEGEGARGMLENLHSAIISVLQAVDVLNIALKTSASGWGLLGQTAVVVAEGLFGTAEGAEKANKKLLEMSSTADKAFTNLVKGFYDGEGLAGEYVEQLGIITVSTDKVTNSTTNMNKALGGTAKKVKDVKVELTDTQKFLEDVQRTSSNGMTSMFMQWQDGALNFRDTMRNVLNDISAQLFQTFVANQAVSFIGGLFGGGAGGSFSSVLGSFANGGAFSNGVQAFANGGIVNSPTLFPMANGMGLMGEAGSEAVLPLKRTSSGDLGVTAQVAPVTVNVNNYGNDEVDVQQTENGIDIVISKITDDIARGKGGLGTAFESRYGLRKV